MLTKFTKTSKHGVVCFRQFTRKSYSVLSSMHRVIKISALASCYTILTLPCKAQGNDSVNTKRTILIDEVAVSPVESSELEIIVTPAVSIIDQQTISNSSYHDVAGLIKSQSGVDIRQRGTHGVQSDISYRGGTFDQTNVMLNNIPISDPQTGHLSLFFPFNSSSVYKAEILSSTSSRYIGSNSIGGTINVLLKPIDTNKADIQICYGSDNFCSGEVSGNFKAKQTKHIISSSYTQSDGYAENTDFKSKNIFYQGDYKIDSKSSLGLMLGYAEKEFGANGFYTPKYPWQFEYNNMSIGALSYKHKGKTNFTADIYYRRHKDRFELFRESLYPTDSIWFIKGNGDTAFYSDYTNHHINTSYGAKMGILLPSRLGNSYIGAHIQNSGIISTNVGESSYDTLQVKGYDALYDMSYQRSKLDITLAHQFIFDRFIIDINTILNVNSEQPEKVNILPGAGIQYKVNSKIGIAGNYAYSMGQPSFTDLFYSDPSNFGNRDLKTYYMHAGDIRMEYKDDLINLNAGGFMKYGKNNIYWVYFADSTANRFNPIHVKESTTLGFELNGKVILEKYINGFIDFHYTYMQTNIESEYQNTKYNPLKHKAVLTFSFAPITNLALTFNTEAFKRDGSYVIYDNITDAYISSDYKFVSLLNFSGSYSLHKLKIFVFVNNILNCDYIDQGSIKQPGINLYSGFKYTI